jgi:site-specific recombinase XerD
MPKKRNHGDGAFYYSKSKKVWRGVVDDGVKPDGTRKQAEVSAKNKEVARAKFEALKVRIREGRTNADVNTTVSEWGTRWLAEVCLPTMQPNGLKSYEGHVRKWIVPTMPNKRVNDVTAADIRAVLARMTKEKIASGTQRKAYTVMSRMFEDARLEKLCQRNPVRDVKAPKVVAQERGSLTTEQVWAVLDAADGHPHGTLWWVALFSGLRQAERAGAQIADLDAVKMEYRVTSTLVLIGSEHGCKKLDDGWECGYKIGGACPQRRYKLPTGFVGRQLHGRVWLGPPKSGKPRNVPLFAKLVERLTAYIESRQHIPNPYGLIWRNDDGNPFLPAQEEQMWRDILYAAGIITAEQLTPGSDIPTGHWARHTTATVLMELGVDPKIIGEIVGHGSERTTRGYQHVSSAVSHEAMGRLSQHWAGELAQLES